MHSCSYIRIMVCKHRQGNYSIVTNSNIIIRYGHCIKLTSKTIFDIVLIAYLIAILTVKLYTSMHVYILYHAKHRKNPKADAYISNYV